MSPKNRRIRIRNRTKAKLSLKNPPLPIRKPPLSKALRFRLTCNSYYVKREELVTLQNFAKIKKAMTQRSGF